MNVRENRPVEWRGDAAQGSLAMLDQRLLPEREEWKTFHSVDEVAIAIRDMTVRGAPAIGVAAAYGMALAAQAAERSAGSGTPLLVAVQKARKLLAATRPTAVNLFWALERMERRAGEGANAADLLVLARAIHDEDVAGNLRMGACGAARLESGMGVLTHCNAGALATGGVGTALGVLFVAWASGKRFHVYVDETRPRLQGARLTAWELSKANIPFTLICDNMAASLMAKGKIQLCVTGADRIAANGDVANKIGTYSVAVNAHHHRLPFYVAAPASTFDLSVADGTKIPIEERAAEEVTDWGGTRTCPREAPVYNPSFDVTPAALIRAIFTDRGEVSPVGSEAIQKVLGGEEGL